MIFPSCKETTRLVSDELERPLTWRERAGMRLHLVMCSACRTYRRQVVGLMKLVGQKRGMGAPMGNGEGLSVEAKARMKGVMREKGAAPGGSAGEISG